MTRRLRGVGGPALLVLAAMGTTPAAGQETEQRTAYARLLAAHVRPVTITGIRLNAVDYTLLRADPRYAQAVTDLAGAHPDLLSSDAARIAFWMNAYNLLAIKAVVDHYPVRSIRDGGNLVWPIWKRKVGTVAGRHYALDEIEHDILRARFHEPRVHMALVCASLSCPDLRREPYATDRLDAQLNDAARQFLANPTKGLQAGPEGRTARVSSIFKWFADDFGGPDGVVRFIRRAAPPAVVERLGGLDARGLSYLVYDWSLNDTSRVGAHQ